MVTDVPFPSVDHIGKERNGGEREVDEEWHVVLELMMVCAGSFLAEILLSAFVVFAVQTESVHVFDTLFKCAGLFAYPSLTDVAVEVTRYHRRHLLDMLGIRLQALQQYLRIRLLYARHYRRPCGKKEPFIIHDQWNHILVFGISPRRNATLHLALPYHAQSFEVILSHPCHLITIRQTHQFRAGTLRQHHDVRPSRQHAVNLLLAAAMYVIR